MNKLNWHKRSLRFRLIATLSLVSVLVWLISTAVAWFQVRKEVNQVFDAQQILFAERLASSDLRHLLTERHNPQPRRPFKKHRFDDDALAFAIFTTDGNIVLSDGENGENFIYAPKKGFSLSKIREDDDDWRIFWLPVAGGRLLPTDNLPTEILPLIKNLNQFFDRTSATLLRERRFTSDAAHELRSPLAALRIQTEVAQLAGDDAHLREQALENLTKGIDRATQLIEQLLTLSRLDNLKELENLQEIHWEQLIPSLMGELYFHAEKHQITLAFEPITVPPVKRGQPLLLALMLRNLIDNAIRYCPAGSQVKVRLEKNKILVEDNGGGVDEANLAKLGQRFYRPAGQNEKGSGLGLSIVRRIAELHHYQLNLSNRKGAAGERIGLCAEILL